jgi:hypothetical protein
MISPKMTNERRNAARSSSTLPPFTSQFLDRRRELRSGKAPPRRNTRDHPVIGEQTRRSTRRSSSLFEVEKAAAGSELSFPSHQHLQSSAGGPRGPPYSRRQIHLGTGRPSQLLQRPGPAVIKPSMAVFRVTVPFEPVVDETLDSRVFTTIPDADLPGGVRIRRADQGYTAELEVDADRPGAAKVRAVDLVERFLTVLASWNQPTSLRLTRAASGIRPSAFRTDQVKGPAGSG